MSRHGLVRLLGIFVLLLLVGMTISPVFAQLPQLGSLFTNNNTSKFLQVNQAFVFNFSQQQQNLVIDWQIEDGYYLYQDKLSVQPTNAEVGALQLPDGIAYEDQYFGKVTIYRDSVEIPIPLVSAANDASLIINYQGCADAGFCYPPESISIPLSAVEAAQTSAADTQNSNENLPITPAANTQVTSLAENWWQPLLFLALGIGLAFTPCVLPMYPILTGIVLGGGQKTPRKTFALSMTYVQGMALTYTLLGLVVASAGLQFQAALQHPLVLIGISLLFLLLAAAMFGVISLQLPASIQTRLTHLSNEQKGGSYGSVFAMGAISGLVCSPCTTAPLSGALLYVAQSGDLLTGAVTLYALALGMGIPLILVALFGNKLLPKAGAWMEKVKMFFGFVLLAAPLFLLERILAENISTILWILWSVVSFGWLYHQSRTVTTGKFASVLAFIAIFGISLSAFQSYQLVFQPQRYLENKSLSFIRIKTIDELENELAKAKSANKAVMLDFYADWCVACKDFEKNTFSDPMVQALLSDYILLQADVTRNDSQDAALLERMQVLGLPTIDFWDKQGGFIKSARLSGFADADAFLTHLQNLH